MFTLLRLRACVLWRQRLFSFAVSNTLRKSIGTVDNSVTIGDIKVDKPPRGDAPHLVPNLPSRLRAFEVNASLPPCHLSHLRWMLQKDLILGQDFLLLGSPSLARDRRHLVLLYASLLGREIEWMSISKDTSEADLKQRKEISNNGTKYVNQAPVRAAIHGRLLILDGLEKSERNVMPTLNNLLENRELPLDDGSMLVSPDVYDVHKIGISVHPDFRVAALASLSDGESAALDPPLRSRFQARLASAVNVGDMLVSTSARSSGKLETKTMKDLVQMAGELSQGVNVESLHDAVRYLEKHQHSVAPRAALNAHGMNISGEMIGVDDLVTLLETDEYESPKENAPHFIETKTTKAIQDLIISCFESGERAVAIVGPKGCYKSAVARNLAHSMGEKCELLSVHPDMTARDLLMTRGTCAESGDTIWVETSLTRAARMGTWVILDGIDKLRSDTLTSLALLMEQGFVVLPDASRFQADDKFRCIAIGQPRGEKSWITPEVKPMFHWIEAKSLPSDELRVILMQMFPSLKRKVLNKILALQERLEEIAVDGVMEKESLQLSMRKMKHICRRVEQRPSELGDIVHNTLMTSFLPDWERGIVEKCLSQCQIVTNSRANNISSDWMEKILESCKRTATNPLLVPNPRFEENPGQSRVMVDILEAHSVGEKALLICGYQGVGKNKIVDYALHLMHCEREYLQLHRDTTIQSLMLVPSVENGRIVYHDSPLIKAAAHGRILVLDEADKAPVEVVALLKGLIEDGQLSLPDGRMLCHGGTSSDHIISIHEDFSIWALANPAGYPFHGNDLSREMADVFSCHIVPPMDAESHKRILLSYGENVHPRVIDKIVKTWEDLRVAHRHGLMIYPFSVRESCSVVKHLNAFPDDGIEDAVENVIAFDRLDRGLSKHLDEVFGGHGIHFSKEEYAVKKRSGHNEGVSTPKTRASSPKHGQTDPNNAPHVGGNTWAGGTGGSDTAGLGGRGGPYRLDSGHPVHQVSDEMKAQVSDEAKRRAKEIAKEALEKKLEELNMGKLDWKRYNNLRTQVEEQIVQLKSHLKYLERRSEERVWMKNQTTGELDENRIADALSGERDVFKRRGNPDDANNNALQSEPITIKLIVDISASMYRFNGYDQRLQRLLEATLMMMEGLRDDKRFRFHIVGHNGSSAKIPLVNPDTKLDEATELRVLEGMVANTQYTYAGDNTVEAIEMAVKEATRGELIIIISDANLERYDINVDDLAPLQAHDVHAHLIFIGSLGDEANELASSIPNERAQICFQSSDLPLIIKKIVIDALRQ